ncbi:hypothetical protein E6C76_02235 [Pseudothauera nasutitermitis]|uniref:DUF4440 domain-containing protein n=1 Tax=Pseudothauera nasutitermitis TaxID=2565930 RepID=A0A4S4B4K2_9RHOO|nr:hypothetical protein [Pseudothauera nasutitermitis]THF67221.1 hypothetical protein E6C76_02235 [Pseudothauera nasutitermitis]
MVTTALAAVSAPLSAFSVESSEDPATLAAIAAGNACLDAFLAALHNGDAQARNATLNYPHVHLTHGQLRVWENAAAGTDFGCDAWDHSPWEERELLHATTERLHIAVSFRRDEEADGPQGHFRALYVVTLQDGHWGIQAYACHPLARLDVLLS